MLHVTSGETLIGIWIFGGRMTSRILIGAIVLFTAMLAYAQIRPLDNRGPKSWSVAGELQQHNNTKPATFWVNGLRLSIEDRPEMREWLEQQVGKNVIVTIRPN